MKKHRLLLTLLSVILFVLISCHRRPEPPAGMTNDSNSAACMAAENEYTARWLADNSSLQKRIKKELDGHTLSFPQTQGSRNDSVIEAAEPWKILVKDRKEVHALSAAHGKATDQVIYIEPDPAFKVSLQVSASKTYIFIISSSVQSVEIRVLPFSCKSLKPVLMQERKPGVIYSAEHFGGNNLWILSNDNAPMRAILIAPDRDPVSSHWKAAVKENDSLFIDSYTIIDLQYLVLVQRRNLSTSIQVTGIYPKNNTEAPVENVINFPEPEGRITGLVYDRKDDKLVFTYSSIITPPTCYTYGIHSMHLGIRWKKQISGYVQDDYKAGVIRAGNRDKVKVPVSVLRKRETEQTEEAKPLLLFIDTEDHPDKETYFSPELISLLNRRFCIARVHLPASLYRSPESTEMVTAAISALADQKLCKTGMVTLAGKGRGAIIALNTFNAHPAWISCLVLNNPGYEVNLATMPVPDTYLVAGNGGLDENLANLKLASEIRRHIKPENTLLVKSNSLQDPDFKSGLITFILAANGINK